MAGPNIRAGEFKHYLRLARKTSAAPNTHLQSIDTWATFAQVYARGGPLTAREVQTLGEVVAPETSHVWGIKWRDDVTAENRVLHRLAIQTALNGAIDNAQTTIVVDASLNQSEGRSLIIEMENATLADRELMEVTARNGLTWTVTRGAYGTTPPVGGHADGTVLRLVDVFEIGGVRNNMEFDAVLDLDCVVRK